MSKNGPGEEYESSEEGFGGAKGFEEDSDDEFGKAPVEGFDFGEDKQETKDRILNAEEKEIIAKAFAKDIKKEQAQEFYDYVKDKLLAAENLDFIIDVEKFKNEKDPDKKREIQKRIVSYVTDVNLNKKSKDAIIRIGDVVVSRDFFDNAVNEVIKVSSLDLSRKFKAQTMPEGRPPRSPRGALQAFNKIGDRVINQFKTTPMSLVIEISKVLEKEKQQNYATADDRTQSRFFDEGIKGLDRKLFNKFKANITVNSRQFVNNFMSYKLPPNEDTIKSIENDLLSLNKDLTDDPNWKQFWTDLKNKNPGMSEQNIVELQAKLLAAYRFRVINLTQQLLNKKNTTQVHATGEIAKVVNNVTIAIKENHGSTIDAYSYLKGKAEKKLGVDVAGQFGSNRIHNIVLKGIEMIKQGRDIESVRDMISEEKNLIFKEIENSPQIKGKVQLAGLSGMDAFKKKFNELYSDDMFLGKIQGYQEICEKLGFDVETQLGLLNKIKDNQSNGLSTKERLDINNYCIVIRKLAYIPYEQIKTNEDINPNVQALLDKEKELVGGINGILAKQGYGPLTHSPDSSRSNTESVASSGSTSENEDISEAEMLHDALRRNAELTKQVQKAFVEDVSEGHHGPKGDASPPVSPREGLADVAAKRIQMGTNPVKREVGGAGLPVSSQSPLSLSPESSPRPSFGGVVPNVGDKSTMRMGVGRTPQPLQNFGQQWSDFISKLKLRDFENHDDKVVVALLKSAVSNMSDKEKKDDNFAKKLNELIGDKRLEVYRKKGANEAFKIIDAINKGDMPEVIKIANNLFEAPNPLLLAFKTAQHKENEFSKILREWIKPIEEIQKDIDGTLCNDDKGLLDIIKKIIDKGDIKNIEDFSHKVGDEIEKFNVENEGLEIDIKNAEYGNKILEAILDGKRSKELDFSEVKENTSTRKMGNN